MIPNLKNDQAKKMPLKLIRKSNVNNDIELGIYKDNQLIGFILDTGYANIEIEIGYVIIPKFKNQGYASEAFKVLIDYLFN